MYLHEYLYSPSESHFLLSKSVGFLNFDLRSVGQAIPVLSTGTSLPLNDSVNVSIV